MKSSLKKFITYYLPPVFWMGLIFYFSSLPGLMVVKNNVEVDAVSRKFGHMLEFGFLAFLFYRIFAERFLFSVSRAVFYGSFLSLIYAASDELHQKFTPFREGTVRDWTYDLAGVVIFLLIFYLVKNNIQKNNGKDRAKFS